MVDITIVFMEVIMVYKPTYNCGAPSCMSENYYGNIVGM